MKKNILKLLLFVLIMFIFVNNTKADENNTTMLINCGEAEIIDFPKHYVNMYRLTNKDGQTSIQYEFGWGHKYIHIWGTNDGEIITKEIIDGGICPLEIDIGRSTVSLVTAKGISNKYDRIIKLEKERYIIYTYEDDGEIIQMAEGYNSEGAYALVGVNIKGGLFSDGVENYQWGLITNDNAAENYFKLDENFNSTYIGSKKGKCKDMTQSDCANGVYKYKVVAGSSEEGQQNLKKSIDDWMNDEAGTFTSFIKLTNLINDRKFIKTCTEIKEHNDNNDEYDLSKIDMDYFINKLNEGQIALNEAYGADFSDCGTDKSTSATSSLVSCAVYSNKLGIKEISDIANGKKKAMLNENYIVEKLYSDSKKLLKELLRKKGLDDSIVDSSEGLNEYTELFYTAALYINSRVKQNKIHLTDEQLKKLRDENGILDKYKELGEIAGIYPVVDCDTLLGEDLINKITSYTNIVKIAVPIILLIFSIFDFTKAMLTNEEEMQKAKKNFIKRIAIALLIFITPTIIGLILQLANKVWTVVSPDSCGIF